MSNSHAYMHDCALTLPLVVVGAVLVGGVDLGAATALAGLGVLLNLAVSDRLTRRFVRAAASGSDPAAFGQPVFKHLMVLPASVLLVRELGAAPVALALATLPAGTLLFALVGLLQRAEMAALATEVAAFAAPSPQESRC
jgi:hypothetical protein